MVIELHNPEDKFEFILMDKQSRSTIKIISSYVYGSDKHEEAKFLVQFLVFTKWENV